MTTATSTPYLAPLPTINPNCSLCHGSGLDPDFGGTCIECLKPAATAWHGSPAAPAPKPTAGPDDAALAAWLATQTWSDFALSLAAAFKKYGRLSPKQAAAAASMKAKVDARNTAKAAETKAADEVAAAAPTKVLGGLDLRSLPSGKYGVPGSDTRLKLQIDVITEGRWAGWVFVKDAAEYGQGNKYGSARPGQTYRGDVEDALAAILADPKAGLARYGALTGHCGICSRKLEDAESVARGIGPICAAKIGF